MNDHESWHGTVELQVAPDGSATATLHLAQPEHRMVAHEEASGPTAREALKNAARRAFPHPEPSRPLKLWHVTSRGTEDYIQAPDEAAAVRLMAHLWDFDHDEQRLDETEAELVNQ